MNLEKYQWDQYNEGRIITVRMPLIYEMESDDEGWRYHVSITTKCHIYNGVHQNKLCFTDIKTKDIVRIPILHRKGNLVPILEIQRVVEADVAGEPERREGIMYPNDRNTLYTLDHGVLHLHEIKQIHNDNMAIVFNEKYARKFMRCIGMTVKPAREMTAAESGYFRSVYTAQNCSSPQKAYEKAVFERYGEYELKWNTYCAVYQYTKEEEL